MQVARVGCSKEGLTAEECVDSSLGAVSGAAWGRENVGQPDPL